MSIVKPIFLTRGEVHIHSEKSLSIHLKSDDKRLDLIWKNLQNKNLKIVIIDPVLDGFYQFYRGNWYIIPKLKYTGSALYQDYTHYSFEYTYALQGFDMKNSTRPLTLEEITRFRSTLEIENVIYS